jgi:TolA-binding protein
MPAPTHDELLEMLEEMDELAGEVRLPMASEDVQLLYPDEATAEQVADEMGMGETSHAHDFEGETWYMPGGDHAAFVDAVEGMDAGMAGLAPVARLNEYKSVGMVEFRGTREGDLDESAIPDDEFEGHYFNPGENKSASSYPLVDAEGYLRRGNLDAAWDLRGQGDLGMPRDAAERLMLNLGLVFGPPNSEANPLPQDAYDERDDVGTPYAAEASGVAAAAGRPDDPGTGEVPGGDTTESTMSNEHTAELGSRLGAYMMGCMEEMSYHEDKNRSEMMEEMASHCGMSKSHMRAIGRGDVMCPSKDAIESMAEILDADMEVLLSAAERDGCEYSSAGGHSGSDNDDMEEESMSMSKQQELKARMADKDERIEELEQKVAELRDEREPVAREYAEALAGEDTVLDADMMVEKFSVSELSEMYDDAAEATLAAADVEPTVRSGSDGEASETAGLSAGEREQVEELEAELAEWQGRESRLARVRVEELEEQLADLRGDN